MSRRPRREPLLVRRGARCACRGDGLCCSDIHAVGPLSEDDVAFLSVISQDAIDKHEGDDEAVLMMRTDIGTCIFWSEEEGCALHAKLGPETKPSPCIQFPFGLTATPVGGRITTQHRCPCRTLGPRPPLSPEAARPCLVDARGELKPDHAVIEPMAWTDTESIDFDEYERRETGLIESLLTGDGLAKVLDADPFPPLDGKTWSEAADELRSFGGSSRASTAGRWLGDALGHLVDRRERAEEARPWASAFEHAAATIVEPEAANRVFGDWLADEVWSLRWTARGSFERARAALATKLAAARRIAGWLDISSPLRDNVSAAEAVTIVDVMGQDLPI